MDIQRLDSIPGLSMGQVRPPGGGGPEGALRALEQGAGSIQNDAGQSLLDIRDELQDAVRAAVQGGNGSGDIRANVEGAIQKTLEDNGFDVDAVKGALEDAGISLQRVRANAGGGDLLARAANALGMEPQSSNGVDDFVNSFLQRLRSGSSLDLLG